MRTSNNFHAGELKSLQTSLSEKTGFTISTNYLVQAFTRSSYSKQCGGENNESFEFIGDIVLNMYVSKALVEHYGVIKTSRNISYNGDCQYALRISEKDLTELRKKIICNKTLSLIMDQWGLEKFLIVGNNDYNNNIEAQMKIKADLFEAILGAITIQSQWNPQILEAVVNKMIPLDTFLKEFNLSTYRLKELSIDQAISTLKELGEKENCSPPQYSFQGPDTLGYDSCDNPKWACSCSVLSWGITRQVWASSKKDAKKYAAYLILTDHFEIINEYGSTKPMINWYLKDGKLSLTE